MSQDQHLRFLREKIQDLRSALFFSMCNSVLKMPATIVTALKVDEVGNVWFFVHRPTQCLSEFDKEFPARLEFFKKGKRFFLKITGKACIVSEPEEVNNLVELPEETKQKAMNQLVLVRVKIQNAEYNEHMRERVPAWLQGLQTQFNKWLYRPQPHYRPYKLAS